MKREVETLAVFVHGALASLHLLGVVYNARRRQWFDASAHALGVVYDSIATIKHARMITPKNEGALS